MATVRLRHGDSEVEVSDDQLSIEEASEKASKILQDQIERFGGRPITGKSTSQKLEEPTHPEVVRDVSINTIVARLGGDSCRAILLAAAAHLTLAQGKQQFTQHDLFELAAQANQWRVAYGSQKARDIKRMIGKGELIENSRNIFRLSSQLVADFESHIDGH